MKVESYKNSDGFLTESEAIYKRREKVLKKLAKHDHTKDTSGMEYAFLCHELKMASRTPDQIRQDRRNEAIRKAYEESHKDCPQCDGRGEEREDGYFGTAYSTCSKCGGTGKVPKDA